MKRKKIVAGNWKMNTDLASALALVTAIQQQQPDASEITKIVFPPFPFIHSVANALNSVDGFFVGAQNCSQHPKGAFTGEVSAEMLASAGCSYVLVGHSERRQYFNEESQQLIAKINQALSNNLQVVFCFGEMLAERKSGKHFETVQQQLEEVLQHYPVEKLAQLTLAYEPVWAIGTGETATAQQAQEMHQFIRKLLVQIFKTGEAAGLSILYGGSCNAQNASELFACPDVDGGLIGGASLKADDFCKIIASF